MNHSKERFARNRLCSFSRIVEPDLPDSVILQCEGIVSFHHVIEMVSAISRKHYRLQTHLFRNVTKDKDWILLSTILPKAQASSHHFLLIMAFANSSRAIGKVYSETTYLIVQVQTDSDFH